MAILKADIKFNFEPLVKMARLYPEISGRLLSLIGARSRILLKEKFLSGQEINLNKFPTDKMGRYTITSDVNRGRTQVKIYSYPVNLFERGRVLRSGDKEAGKYIITRKLKQAVMSRLATYSREAEKEIIGPEFRRIGL